MLSYCVVFSLAPLGGERENRPVAFPEGAQRPCGRTGLPRRFAPRNDGARGEDPAPYSEEYALHSEESTLCSPPFILFFST
jgi:hypothetical protein